MRWQLPFTKMDHLLKMTEPISRTHQEKWESTKCQIWAGTSVSLTIRQNLKKKSWEWKVGSMSIKVISLCFCFSKQQVDVRSHWQQTGRSYHWEAEWHWHVQWRILLASDMTGTEKHHTFLEKLVFLMTMFMNQTELSHKEANTPAEDGEENHMSSHLIVMQSSFMKLVSLVFSNGINNLQSLCSCCYCQNHYMFLF